MPTKKAAAKTTRSKRTTSKAKKASPAKEQNSKTKAGDQEITIDRRQTADRRSADESESIDGAAKPKIERRAKVQRRRQIDPTTCERDYSIDEVEFMNAMDEYKRTSGRMFPTCSEVLEVIRNLGYVRLSPAEMALIQPHSVESEQSEEDAESQTPEESASQEEELEMAGVNGWTA